MAIRLIYKICSMSGAVGKVLAAHLADADCGGCCRVRRHSALLHPRDIPAALLRRRRGRGEAGVVRKRRRHSVGSECKQERASKRQSQECSLRSGCASVAPSTDGGRYPFLLRQRNAAQPLQAGRQAFSVTPVIGRCFAQASCQTSSSNQHRVVRTASLRPSHSPLRHLPSPTPSAP